MIRKSTLVVWTPPNPEEIREAVRLTGLTAKAVGERLGDTTPINPRTVRKWLGGEQGIPAALWYRLATLAGLELIEAPP